MGEDKTSGWLGTCLGGCAIILVIGISAGYFIYLKIMEGGRSLAASAFEMGVTKAMEGMSFSQSETDKLMVPVKDFTKKIREGKIGVADAMKVGETIFKSPVIPAFIAYSFENHHVKTGNLSDQEKKDAHVTITRFMRGAIEEKIDKKKMDELQGIISETVNENGRTTHRLKKSLSQVELRQCLDLMKSEADRVKIVEGADVDLPAELEKAFQKGLSAK